MRANAEPFTFLDKERQVRIPYFQRPYVWKLEHWDRLLSDLRDVCINGGNTYLGTIILQTVASKPGKIGHSVVIDGQQRLTTLSLLLKALHDSFDDTYKERGRASGRYNGCLFCMSESFEGDVSVKIDHSKLDAQCYQAIIKSEAMPPKEDFIMARSLIAQCYYHYEAELTKITFDERWELFKSLLNDYNEIMIVIRLSEEDNEQRIFDTMNTMGARLSSADTFKNYFFEKLFDDDFTREEVEDLYEKNWEGVFAKDEETITFWREPRGSRDRTENLLRYTATIRGDFTSQRLDKLPEIYKALIDNMDKDAKIQLLETIASYARIYKNNSMMFDNSNKNNFYSLGNYKKRLYRVAKIYGVSSFQPYILYLEQLHAGDEITLEKEFHKLETMLLRRCVCKSGSSEYGRLAIKLIGSDPSQRDELFEEYTPSDKELEAALKHVDENHLSSAYNMVKFILLMVELYRRSHDVRYIGNRHYAMKSLEDKFTLEHIMPKSWGKYWEMVPVVPECGGRGFTKEDYDNCRNAHIYQIGNLTLLENAQNEALSNYDFRTKIEGGVSFGPFEGMRSGIQLGITWFDIVKPYMHGVKFVINKGTKRITKHEHRATWDEERIRERTKSITDDVLAIWPLNKVEDAAEAVDEEIVICEAEVLSADDVQWEAEVITEAINEKMEAAYEAHVPDVEEVQDEAESTLEVGVEIMVEDVKSEMLESETTSAEPETELSLSREEPLPEDNVELVEPFRSIYIKIVES
ncbi:MAG: DUF262 domain-containing protein [Defluviitaleaceae bacterium]|nr:DUF262 domain-containing protein [Defluviitaleaceae bacterium]